MAADSYRTDVFLYSECTWVDGWVSADDRDDPTGRNAAGAGLTSLVARGSQVPPVDLEDAHRDYLRRLASAASTSAPDKADRALLQHEREVGCGWNYR